MKNNELISKFFQFLERKKGTKTPFKYKLLNHDKFEWSKKDLFFKKDLDLRNTKVTSLPDGLEVRGDLWLRNTPIKTLPKNLKVGESIFVDKDKLEYFQTKYPHTILKA